GPITQRDDGEWTCAVAHVGFWPEPRVRTYRGSDPMEALVHALMITRYIRWEGRTTWCGSEDLGFPTLVAEPSHRLVFRPADGGPDRKLWVKVHHPARVADGWRVLVELVDCSTYQSTERDVAAARWSDALALAAGMTDVMLSAFVDEHGGGTLE